MRPPSHRPGASARSTRLGAALLVTVGISLALGTIPALADPITDTDQTIETLRREADQAANAYFDELAKAQTLEAQIAKIEDRLPALSAQRRKLLDAVRDRAVAAYKRRGIQIGAPLDVKDALTVVRRTRLLDGLNAADNRAFNKLTRVTDQLHHQREQLQGARASLQATLDELQRRGKEIDAKLKAAEDRRRRLAAAAAVAKAAAAAKPSGGGGSANAPPAPPSTYIGTPGTHPHHNDPFLVCTRGIESGGNYQAYNPAGPYMGAYQFLQSTWDSTANHAGRTGLIGVRPDHATQFDQDDMAWTLYQWQGSRPWGGRCD